MACLAILRLLAHAPNPRPRPIEAKKSLTVYYVEECFSVELSTQKIPKFNIRERERERLPFEDNLKPLEM